MSNGSGYVYDVTERDFEERVVRASFERPVAVDFWAPWCHPCRMLGPALERIVRSFDGQMALAKLNVDDAQQLALQYGIRGIPAVKVFRNGDVAAEFVGAKREAEVREILSAALPSEADELVGEAAELMQAGQTQEAETVYRRVLEKVPSHPGALLGLAEAAVKRGDVANAREAAERIQLDAPEYKDAERVLAQIDFMSACSDIGGKETAEKEAAKKPDDLAASYALAMCLAAAGEYGPALEELLHIVERDKHYHKDSAKTAIVRIFTIVGKNSALANKYRHKLLQVLY